MKNKILELSDSRPLTDEDDLTSVTHLILYGHATLPPGTELPSVRLLELHGYTTLPPEIELPAVTTLILRGHATLPPGTELPALQVKIPVVENLHKKVWDAIKGDPGKRLNMLIWHACETTHCRAGWAIYLAGEEGKKCENKLDEHTAGALIYLKSTGMIPDFFCDSKTAIEDIKRCAEVN